MYEVIQKNLSKEAVLRCSDYMDRNPMSVTRLLCCFCSTRMQMAC